MALRRAWRLASLLVVCVALLPACSMASSQVDPPRPPNPAQPLPTIRPEVRQQRGTIISSTQIPDLSPPLRAVGATKYTVAYRSTSGIDGTEQNVSGTILVPPGEPPLDGWPVIAYGHGGSGISTECGPSRFPDLKGYDDVAASLVALGYIVALTDYEGLGMGGVYPFLEPATAAFNMIDSVRAARQIVPDASTRWLAVGVSEGGQASWAANELAKDYGEGLQFLGSASLSPFVDLSELPGLAEAGWLTKAQQAMLPALVFGLRNTHPNLNPDDYLHGALARNQDMWLACAGPLAARQSTAVGELKIADSQPVTAEAREALRQALRSYALPQRLSTAPMLVITGSDDDTVRSQWITSAVERACAQGGVVEFVVRPGEGHHNLEGGPRVAQWLSERLTGEPPVNTCGA
ncbi:hypothetical protein A5662_03140 [Mycobacteriaceae bacterium 1482268.1]|nr:hypothetical protein A5662_03140 [Mycobacteriaceae bacterium 1482268.1]